MMYRTTGKRIFDLMLVIVALAMLWPVLLMLALLVLGVLGRPVMFLQVRAGLHGRAFTLLKFRTLHEGAGSDAVRMTKLGRVLRAYGLDEFPQLLNVLRGEMSFVGPRPLPVHYAVPAARQLVKPGITGTVQIGGRNALPWAQRFHMDTGYVRDLCLLNDLRYLLRTPHALLRGDGACTPGHATASAPDGGLQ